MPRFLGQCSSHPRVTHDRSGTSHVCHLNDVCAWLRTSYNEPTILKTMGEWHKLAISTVGKPRFDSWFVRKGEKPAVPRVAVLSDFSSLVTLAVGNTLTQRWPGRDRRTDTLLHMSRRLSSPPHKPTRMPRENKFEIQGVSLKYILLVCNNYEFEFYERVL